MQYRSSRTARLLGYLEPIYTLFEIAQFTSVPRINQAP